MKLTAFAAITSWRELRLADSSAQSLLSDAAESASLRVMNNAPIALPTELPEDIDALRALILAERARHAAVVAERNTIAVERDLLSVRTEKLGKHPAEAALWQG